MTTLIKNPKDRRTILFISLYFVAVTLLWSEVFSNPVATVLLYALTCGLSFIGAVITHNSLHTPVFTRRTLNRIFQVALTLTYGFPVNEFVPGHNLSHHRYTQTRKDTMRTTKVQYRYNWLSFLMFFPTVAIDVTRANYAYVGAMKHKMVAWYHQLMLEGMVCWGSKFILLIIDWKKCVFYIVVPHALALWGITSINYFQHDGCDQNSEFNHSRNFMGKLFNWLTFNNGYHGMHHMEPAMHWSLLPQKHAEIFSPHIHPALEQKSFFVYVFRTLFFPGKRVRYDGAPLVLPENGPDESWVSAMDSSLFVS